MLEKIKLGASPNSVIDFHNDNESSNFDLLKGE